MWFTPEVRRILAYSKPVDLRNSIDGLVGLVKSVLEEDPLSGSLFVFVNRRGNYLKLVSWDRTGWGLFAKQLNPKCRRFDRSGASCAHHASIPSPQRQTARLCGRAVQPFWQTAPAARR